MLEASLAVYMFRSSMTLPLIGLGMSYRRFESVIFASSPCVESPNGYVATGSMLEAPPLTRTRRMPVVLGGVSCKPEV